jgi:hypothetical protein
MNKQPHIPDPETSKRLLANLRRTRLEMEEFNLQLDEIIARFEQDLSQQKLQRVRRSLANLKSAN